MDITLKQTEIELAVKEYIKNKFGADIPKVELATGRGAAGITATMSLTPDTQFSIGANTMTKLADKPKTETMPFVADKPAPEVEPIKKEAAAATAQPVKEAPVEIITEPVVQKVEPTPFIEEAEPEVGAAPSAGLFASAPPVSEAAATTADTLFPSS